MRYWRHDGRKTTPQRASPHSERRIKTRGLMASEDMTYAFGRIAPLILRASRRAQRNNGNLPRARQNHARSRCESASAPKDARACRTSREYLRPQEAIGSGRGWQMRGSRKQRYGSNLAAGIE